MNRVFLLGRLGKDPEVKFGSSGTAVAKFSLATDEKWQSDGQLQQKTEWHQVVVFSKQAENVGQYLHKGSQVLVEGKIQYRSYDDQRGNKKYITEIIAQRVQFLSSGNGASRSDLDAKPVDDDDDIPPF